MTWFGDVWEGFFTVLVGMNITWRHLFTRKVTLHYPEEKWVLPPRSRMRLFMKYEDCIGCGQCARACPVQCIYIKTDKRAPTAPEVPADLTSPPTDAVRTKSGLVYRVLQKGTGTLHPRANSVVEVHYSGWTADGKMFDSSVQSGQPATFPLNGVIPGWTEGVQLMKVGSKYKFYIPSALGYGERGAGGVIGPNAPLIFEVELLSAK